MRTEEATKASREPKGQIEIERVFSDMPLAEHLIEMLLQK